MVDLPKILGPQRAAKESIQFVSEKQGPQKV